MLHPLPEVDLSGQLFFHLLQSGRLTQTQLLRPIQPGGSPEFVLQGHEQGVVFQPVRAPEGAPHLKFVSPRQPGDGEAQHLKAVFIEELIVCLSRVVSPVQKLIFFGLQKAPLSQDI